MDSDSSTDDHCPLDLALKYATNTAGSSVLHEDHSTLNGTVKQSCESICSADACVRCKIVRYTGRINVLQYQLGKIREECERTHITREEQTTSQQQERKQQEKLLKELQQSLLERDQFIATSKRKRLELEVEVNTLKDRNTNLTAEMVLKDQSSVEEKSKITNDCTLKVRALQEQLEGLQESLIEKDQIIATNQSLMSEFEIDRKALKDRNTSLTAEMVLKDQSSVEEMTKITNDCTLKVRALQEQMEGLQQSLGERDVMIAANQSRMLQLEMDRTTLSDRNTTLSEEMVLKDQVHVEEKAKISKDGTLKVRALQEQLEGLQESLIEKDQIIATNQSLMSEFEIDRKALKDRITSLTAEMVLKDQSSVEEMTKKSKEFTLKISDLQDQIKELHQSRLEKDQTIRELSTKLESQNHQPTELTSDELEDSPVVVSLRECIHKLEMDLNTLSDQNTSLTAEMVLKDQVNVEEKSKISEDCTLKVRALQEQMEGLQESLREKDKMVATNQSRMLELENNIKRCDKMISEQTAEAESLNLATELPFANSDELEDNPTVDLLRVHIHKLERDIKTLSDCNTSLTAEMVLKDQSTVVEITAISNACTLKVRALQEQLEGLQESLIEKDQIIATNQSLMLEFEIDRKALKDRNTSLTAEMVLKDQSSVEEMTKKSKEFTLKISDLQDQIKELHQSRLEKDQTILELSTKLESQNHQPTELTSDELEDSPVVVSLRECIHKLEMDLNTLSDQNTSLTAEMVLKDQVNVEEKSKISEDCTLKVRALQEQMEGLQESLREKDKMVATNQSRMLELENNIKRCDKMISEQTAEAESLNLATELPFANTDELEDNPTVDLLRVHIHKLERDIKTLSDCNTSLTAEMVLKDQSSAEEMTKITNNCTLKVSMLQEQMEGLQQSLREKDQTFFELTTHLESQNLATELPVVNTDELVDSPTVVLLRERIHKLEIEVNTLRDHNTSLTAEMVLKDQSYSEEKTKKKDLEDEPFFDALDFVSEEKDVETSAYRTIGKYLIRGLIGLSAVTVSATGGFLLGSSVWSEDAGCYYDLRETPAFF